MTKSSKKRARDETTFDSFKDSYNCTFQFNLSTTSKKPRLSKKKDLTVVPITRPISIPVFDKKTHKWSRETTSQTFFRMSRNPNEDESKCLNNGTYYVLQELNQIDDAFNLLADKMNLRYFPLS